MQIAPKKDDCIKVQPSNDVCPEGYYNNSCVMLGVSGSASQAPTYAYVNGCDGAGNVVDAKALPTMHSNRIYNPSGAVRVACALLAPPWNTTSITLEAFQNQGSASQAVQFHPNVHPNGGQVDCVWLPARTEGPHGGASYVRCLTA